MNAIRVRPRPKRFIAAILPFALACLVVPGHAGVRVGVEGALHMAHLTGTFADLSSLPVSQVTLSSDATPSGEVGLVAEVPLPGPFGLAAGLAYSPVYDTHAYQNYSEFGLSIVNEWGKMRTRLQTLVLPVRVEWRPSAFRLGAGPEVRYVMDATRDVVDYTSGVTGVVPNRAGPGRGGSSDDVTDAFLGGNFKVTHEVADLYRRWGLGGSAAVGFEAPVGRHLVRCDLRISQGFTNLSKFPGASEKTTGMLFGAALLW